MRQVKVNRFVTLNISEQDRQQQRQAKKITKKINPVVKAAGSGSDVETYSFFPCQLELSKMSPEEVHAEIRHFLVHTGVIGIQRPQQVKAPQFAGNRHLKRVQKAA